MGWKQFVRALEADARRQRRAAERSAMQRYRELHRSQKEEERRSKAQAKRRAKEAEKFHASQEVGKFETYIDLLVSIHKDSSDPWNWPALANTPAPTRPSRSNKNEATAVAAMQSYKPGFFEKLFGGDKKRTAALMADVTRARQSDEEEYASSLRDFEVMSHLWSTRRSLATRILRGDISCYPEALAHAASLDEIYDFKTRVAVAAIELGVVAFTCEITDDELVPSEELKLTATGKVSTKSMAAGRYWALYQDHICSCALRIAGEAFAVLPVSRVIVNIGRAHIDKSTGHQKLSTFLGVHFSRDALAKLNLTSIDPSDSMKNFPHRMKFKKTTGFEPVEAITTDEQWITT